MNKECFVMAIPRMRTAEGVLAEIKTQDPDTDVTLHYIRYLMNTEAVPVVSVGRKKLVNVDKVIAFLASESPEKEIEPIMGQIRRVKG
jgi:predicted aldo/keto reductase-like oxidoreductase